MKTPAKLLADIIGSLPGARTALNDLHEGDKELRTMHEALQADLSRLDSSRPPRDELRAAGYRQIDAQEAAWSAAHGLELIDAIRSGNLGEIPTASAEKKRDLRAALDLVTYEPGPPTSERPRHRAELVARIADVEDQHSQLVDRAAELGIALELLPDVRMRRAHEAHLAGLRERDARDRARK